MRIQTTTVLSISYLKHSYAKEYLVGVEMKVTETIELRLWVPKNYFNLQYYAFATKIGWLFFKFKSPLRQYFSLYRAVSQREEQNAKFLS